MFFLGGESLLVFNRKFIPWPRKPPEKTSQTRAKAGEILLALSQRVAEEAPALSEAGTGAEGGNLGKTKVLASKVFGWRLGEWGL